jgi:ABC-type multidrug transport system fused ATPase/permease subunit
MDRLDEVVVMENGRLIDRGAHADLHARNPRYASWCARMR